jgi:hypothetical protein
MRRRHFPDAPLRGDFRNRHFDCICSVRAHAAKSDGNAYPASCRPIGTGQAAANHVGHSDIRGKLSHARSAKRVAEAGGLSCARGTATRGAARRIGGPRDRQRLHAQTGRRPAARAGAGGASGRSGDRDSGQFSSGVPGAGTTAQLLGVERVLAKPLNRGDLLEAVRAIIGPPG